MQCTRKITSVLRGMPSVHWMMFSAVWVGDTISTMGGILRYCGVGVPLVQWRVFISAMGWGESISTVDCVPFSTVENVV